MDECSGITQVINPSGTNETMFIVQLNGVDSVGQAVLITNETDFCGEETLSENSTNVIMCETTRTSQLDSYGVVSMLDSGSDYVIFQCRGEGDRIPEGQARIVFERTLMPNQSSSCENLTVSRPYFTNYSAFEVEWRHRGGL